MLHEHIYTSKNVCVLLDGCFSSFVISNKHINHCGKRISSHLMADKAVCEMNFLFSPCWFISQEHLRYNLSFLIWLQWHAFLQISIMVSLSPPQLANKSKLRGTICHWKSEHWEMARMICSFEHFTNTKTILLLTIFDGIIALTII